MARKVVYYYCFAGVRCEHLRPFQCRGDHGFPVMDCEQLSQILKRLEATKNYFRACLTADLLYLYDIFPDRTNIFIILTESANKKIGHFLLVYIDKNGSVVIFDPIGTNYVDIPDEIKKFVSNNKSVRYNEKRLQGPNSCLCGVFCIFFAIYLSAGYCFEHVISWFADPLWNDVSVYSWFVGRVARPSLTSVLTPARMFLCKF